jgi:hypothetical protein
MPRVPTHLPNSHRQTTQQPYARPETPGGAAQPARAEVVDEVSAASTRRNDAQGALPANLTLPQPGRGMPASSQVSASLSSHEHNIDTLLQKLFADHSRVIDRNRAAPERRMESASALATIRNIRQSLTTDRKNAILTCYARESEVYRGYASKDKKDLALLEVLSELSSHALAQTPSMINDIIHALPGKFEKTPLHRFEVLPFLKAHGTSLPQFFEICLLLYPEKRHRSAYTIYRHLELLKNTPASALPDLYRLITDLKERSSTAQPHHYGWKHILPTLLSCYTQNGLARTQGLLDRAIEAAHLGCFPTWEKGLEHISLIPESEWPNCLNMMNETRTILGPRWAMAAVQELLQYRTDEVWRSCLAGFRIFCPDFAALDRAAPNSNPNSSRISNIIHSIIATPAAGRSRHAQALHNSLWAELRPVENTLGQPIINPYRVDEENVMRSTPIARTKTSILALARKFPTRPPAIVTVVAITKYLFYEPLSAQGAELAAFTALRAGTTEQFNALRALAGPRQPDDYSDSVRANPPYDLGPVQMGLGDITALIWTAIDRYQPNGTSQETIRKDQALMRYHVFKALSQCIEDDGHRVCSVGYAQRIVTALQGFYPNEVRVDDDAVHMQDAARIGVVPQVFFTQLAQAFDRSHPESQEPTPQRIRTFGDNTIAQAIEAYGANAPQVAQVARMLEEYIQITYDLHMLFRS